MADSESLKKRRILVVEDDDLLNKSLVGGISVDGFSVDSVKDGQECINYLDKNTPDLIILDLEMPGLDGVSVLGKMKGNNSLKNIPVIVLTNHDDTERIASVISEGVTDYMIKSDSSMDDILNKVKEKLDLK